MISTSSCPLCKPPPPPSPPPPPPPDLPPRSYFEQWADQFRYELQVQRPDIGGSHYLRPGTLDVLETRIAEMVDSASSSSSSCFPVLLHLLTVPSRFCFPQRLLPVSLIFDGGGRSSWRGLMEETAEVFSLMVVVVVVVVDWMKKGCGGRCGAQKCFW